MAAITLPRTIDFEGKKLKDVPGMSAQELRLFYARIYPELSTATAHEDITPKGITVTFTTGYKSKG